MMQNTVNVSSLALSLVLLGFKGTGYSQDVEQKGRLYTDEEVVEWLGRAPKIDRSVHEMRLANRKERDFLVYEETDGKFRGLTWIEICENED